MKHLRQRIRKIWESRKNPLKKLWRWAHAPDALARVMQRWRALKEWAREHARIAGKRGEHDKRKWWLKRQHRYDNKFDETRKRFLAQHDDPEPQPTSNVGTWDGRQVAGWMVGAAPGVNGTRTNWLAKIKAAGWPGGIYSGYRSPAYSTQLCMDICGHPSCPGLCAGASSNHSGLTYPGGAIDVADWEAFERANAAVGGPFHNYLPSDRPHRSVSGY